MMLLDEIRRQAAGDIPLQKALIAGAVMEGGSLEGPWPDGDAGRSVGPYQIKYWKLEDPVWRGHPISKEDAKNPATAVAYAIKYVWDPVNGVMAGLNYRGLVKQYDTIEAVFRAERPAHMYSADQQARAWAVINSLDFGENPMTDFVVPTVRKIRAHPNNILVRPQGVLYEGCVVHTTAGGTTIDDLGAWFAGGNIRAGVTGSTHFGVDDGVKDEVGQYLELSEMAIAHGQDDKATARLVRENGSLTANAYLIGWELLDKGRPGQHTPRQRDRLARHMAHVWKTEIEPYKHITGAVIDRDHILGHYELAPKTRTCPEWPEIWFTELIDKLQELVYEAAPVDPLPEPEDKLAAVLKKIDDLYNEQIRQAVTQEHILKYLRGI